MINDSAWWSSTQQARTFWLFCTGPFVLACWSILPVLKVLVSGSNKKLDNLDFFTNYRIVVVVQADCAKQCSVYRCSIVYFELAWWGCSEAILNRLWADAKRTCVRWKKLRDDADTLTRIYAQHPSHDYFVNICLGCSYRLHSGVRCWKSPARRLATFSVRGR